MTVAAALQKRVSTRAFLPTPIDRELLHQIFRDAQRSPSNCNVQPWQVYVVSDAPLARLQASLVAEAASGRVPTPDFDWGLKYDGEQRERQFGAAAALYDALGIDRSDREARTQAMLRNWEFFGAPHAAFFAMERGNGIRGAVDLGIYAQSLALLLAENDIGSCMQGALNQFPEPARAMLGIPEQFGILFGMSFGYADPNAPANAARTVREPLEKAVFFLD